MPQTGETGTYEGQDFNLSSDSFQDYYYQTGGGGIVPIVSQADLDNIQGAGFTPFQFSSDDLATNQAPLEDTYEADQAAIAADTAADIQTTTNYWDAEIANELTIIDEGFSNLDEDYASQMASITSMFGVRRAALLQLNAATMGGLTKSGIRSGRQRYANEMQTSILSAEEAAGIQRIATLNSEELMLKSELESAIRDKRWDLMNYKTDKLRELRAEKKAELSDLRIKQQDENNRLQNEIRWEREGIEFEQGQFIELYNNAITKVENFLASDVAITDIAAEDIAQLEEDLDLMAGTFETFYTNRIAAEEAAAALAALELTGTTLDIEKKRIDADVKILNAQLDVPLGVKFTINGIEYTGMKVPKAGADNKFGPGIAGITIKPTPANTTKLYMAGIPRETITAIYQHINTPDPETGEVFTVAEIMNVVAEGLEITPDMQVALEEVFGNAGGVFTSETDLFSKFGGDPIEGMTMDWTQLPELMEAVEQAANQSLTPEFENSLYDMAKLNQLLNIITSDYNLTDAERAELKQLVIQRLQEKEALAAEND